MNRLTNGQYAERWEQIRVLKKKGVLRKDIAAAHSISLSMVTHILNQSAPSQRKVREFKCEFCGKQSSRSGFRQQQDTACDTCRVTFQGRDRTRERVRIKYHRTCQGCQRVWKPGERRFDVHHLKGLCGKKSKGYDVTTKDLTVLCHRCHFNSHSWAGWDRLAFASPKEKLRIAQKRKERTYEMFDAGQTRRAIAEKLDISYARVTTILLDRPK